MVEVAAAAVVAPVKMEKELKKVFPRKYYLFIKFSSILDSSRIPQFVSYLARGE